MLNRSDVVLIVVDIQEKLLRVMEDKEALIDNNIKLIKGFQTMGLPLLVTEQIPEKIGPTFSVLAEEIIGFAPIVKESFSCWGEMSFCNRLASQSKKHIILTGIECHVCVYQTALDLIDNGYEVHIVGDAISSRAQANRQIGLDAMKKAGAWLTSTEMVLFELLRSAAHPRAREIFKIVK